MKIYWTNFKPFWAELTNQYLREDIETFLINAGYVWYENNKNKFIFDNDGIKLITERNDINYLKLITDEGIIFYYYKSAIPYAPMSSVNNEIREYLYEIDLYNTILRDIFIFFENENINVFAVKGFLNRFEMSKHNGLISASYNNVRMKYLNQIIPSNNTYVKRYLISTNPDEMADINNVSDNLDFTNFIGSGTLTFTKEELNIANRNNRFTYFKAASSSFVANLTITQGILAGSADMLTDYDFLFIVPNTSYDDITGITHSFYRPELFYKYIYPSKLQLENLDIDFLNPSGNNFISMYDRDIPYSVICEKFKDSLRYISINLFDRGDADDRIDKTVKYNNILIPVILLRMNTAININLYQFKQLNNNIFGKLIYMIQNIYKWDPETEPLLISPAYYKEEILIDSEKKLTLDSGLIDINIPDIYNIVDSNFYLNAKIIFDQTGILIYDFGDNTNYLNVWWNNYFSNCRFEDASQIGYKTSALANYCADNVAAIYTAHMNLKDTMAHRQTGLTMNLTQDWMGQVFSGLSSGIGLAGTVLKGNNTKSLISALSAGADQLKRASNNIFSTIRNVKNYMYQNKIDLRNYSENIKNISSAANSPISTPFLTSYYTNIKRDNNYLFAIWSNELNNIDKLNIFNDIINNGYIINYFIKLSDMRNRKYMNYYLIDWDRNKNYLWRVYQKFNKNSYFNNNYWFDLFITFFNDIKIWESNIINCVNYGYIENNNIVKNNDYIDNYEIIIDDFFNSSILNTDLNNLDLTNYYFFNKSAVYVENFIHTLTTFKDWADIEIIINNDSVIFKPITDKYIGTLIKNTRKTEDINDNLFYSYLDQDLNYDDYKETDPENFLLTDYVRIKNYIGFLISKKDLKLWEDIKDYLEIDDYLLHDDFDLNFYSKSANIYLSYPIGIGTRTDKTILWTVKFKINLNVNNADFSKPTYLINSRIYERILFNRWYCLYNAAELFNLNLIAQFKPPVTVTEIKAYCQFKIYPENYNYNFNIRITTNNITVDNINYFTSPNVPSYSRVIGTIRDLNWSNNFNMDNIGVFLNLNDYYFISDGSIYSFNISITPSFWPVEYNKLNNIKFISIDNGRITYELIH